MIVQRTVLPIRVRPQRMSGTRTDRLPARAGPRRSRPQRSAYSSAPGNVSGVPRKTARGPLRRSGPRPPSARRASRRCRATRYGVRRGAGRAPAPGPPGSTAAGVSSARRAGRTPPPRPPASAPGRAIARVSWSRRARCVGVRRAERRRRARRSRDREVWAPEHAVDVDRRVLGRQRRVCSAVERRSRGPHPPSPAARRAAAATPADIARQHPRQGAALGRHRPVGQSPLGLLLAAAHPAQRLRRTGERFGRGAGAGGPRSRPRRCAACSPCSACASAHAAGRTPAAAETSGGHLAELGEHAVDEGASSLGSGRRGASSACSARARRLASVGVRPGARRPSEVAPTSQAEPAASAATAPPRAAAGGAAARGRRADGHARDPIAEVGDRAATAVTADPRAAPRPAAIVGVDNSTRRSRTREQRQAGRHPGPHRGGARRPPERPGPRPRGRRAHPRRQAPGAARRRRQGRRRHPRRHRRRHPRGLRRARRLRRDGRAALHARGHLPGRRPAADRCRATGAATPTGWSR